VAGIQGIPFGSIQKGRHTTIVSLDGTWKSYFLRGLTVQMTNPKAALAMIAIVSLGIHSGAPAWVGIVIVLGTTTLSLVAHLLYAITFSTTPMVILYTRARRAIQAVLGTFFSAMGIRLLAERD
jgi:threonine/homoserine/homoserine lactone efflux protein